MSFRFVKLDEMYRGCALGLVYEDGVPYSAWKSTLERKWQVVLLPLRSKSQGALMFEAAAQGKVAVDINFALAAEEFARGEKLSLCDREKIVKEMRRETH